MEELKIGKDAEIENKEKNIFHAKKEIEGMKKSLKDSLQLVDWNKRETEIIVGNIDVLVNKFVPLNPNWEFEKDETYLSNMRELNKLNSERKIFTLHKQSEQLQIQTDSIKEQIKAGEEAVDKLEKELGELKGE